MHGNQLDEYVSSSYSPNADFWITIIRNNMDRYRTELTNSAVLEAVGDCSGRRILDAGCGEGYMSRLLAARGADVQGVDICPELIASASEQAEGDGLAISYDVADLAKIPVLDESFDLIVANHVITDIQHPESMFSEFARVLRLGGRIVIMMLHPCFYSAQAERKALKGYATPKHYFSTRIVEQEFNVAGLSSPSKVKMWFRPLEDYVSLLTRNGFAITGMTEPHPRPEQYSQDSWWKENFVRPLFLLIKAEKQSR